MVFFSEVSSRSKRSLIWVLLKNLLSYFGFFPLFVCVRRALGFKNKSYQYLKVIILAFKQNSGPVKQKSKFALFCEFFSCFAYSNI